MLPVTTHFEQIPVEVVKKIVAQTSEAAVPGPGVQPGDADPQGPISSRADTVAAAGTRPHGAAARFKSPLHCGARK
jgi:hypothetical protein